MTLRAMREKRQGFLYFVAGSILISLVYVVHQSRPISLDYLENISDTYPGAKLLAEENGLKFSVEDRIAKSYIPRKQPIDKVLGSLSGPDFGHDEVTIWLTLFFCIGLTPCFGSTCMI